MKIGILTFHCAHNYGAVLQAYGLQEYLCNQGHDVYIIDYRPKYLKKAYSKWALSHWISKSPLKTIKKLAYAPGLIKERYKRYAGFENFIHTKLHLYPYSAKSDFSNFDLILLGSDQIWNAKITGGMYDSVFFGYQAKCKIASYAASSQLSALTHAEEKLYGKYLSRFSGISVREICCQKLLQPLTERKVELCLDPTLLAGKDIFEKIATPPYRKKPYILIYEMGTDIAMPLAKKFAKTINADILNLQASVSLPHKGVENIFGGSPEDFVGLIKNAACVITTSFHGLAFSLMMQKPFYAIRQHNNSDIRLDSLLAQLGLENYFIEKDATSDFPSLDYTKVYFDSIRNTSINYLSKITG